MTAPSVKNVLNGSEYNPDLVNEDFNDIINYIAQRNNGGAYWDNVNAINSLITNLTVTDLIVKGPHVDVRAYATGGTGTSANPWTGWDTAITWAAGVEYYFPAGADGLHGFYSYSTSPSWTFDGLKLKGDSSSSSILSFTGTGVAVNFDGSSGSAGGVFNICIEDLLIKGNASCTYGIYALAVHHFNLTNITIIDTPTAGIFADFVVLGTWENVRVTNLVFGPVQSTITPNKGIILSKSLGADSTSVVTLINPIVESVTTRGIELDFAGGNVIIGGVSESNATGIVLTENCNDNTIFGLDCEANSVIDMLIAGIRNAIYSGTGLLHLISPATDNRFIGGTFITSVTIDASCVRNSFIDGSYNGTLTDNGTNTRFLYFKNSTSGTYVATKFPEAVTFGGMITTPLTASRALATGASNELAVSATTATELGYVSGVTSAIQTQFGTKKSIATGNAFKFETTDTSGNLQETTVTASRAVVTDSNGLPTAATTTATEIGYVNGVTSAIQTQINTKAPSASPTFTGTVTTPLTASRAVATGASSELAASATTATQLTSLSLSATDYSSTSTVVGFSATTTKLIYSLQIGNMVHVWARIIGTSDATTLTFTVPVANANLVRVSGACRVQDNGTIAATPGHYRIDAAASTVQIFKDQVTTAFTASGDKLVEVSLMYPAS